MIDNKKTEKLTEQVLKAKWATPSDPSATHVQTKFRHKKSPCEWAKLFGRQLGDFRPKHIKYDVYLHYANDMVYVPVNCNGDSFPAPYFFSMESTTKTSPPICIF